LSETAFIVKEEAGYHLRWFTPGTEVELCGHATLASAFVMLNYYEKDSDKIEFNTLSGKLTVVHEEIDSDKTRHISIEIHFNLKPIPEVEQVKN